MANGKNYFNVDGAAMADVEDPMPVALVSPELGAFAEKQAISTGDLYDAYFTTQSMVGSTGVAIAGRLARFVVDDDPNYNPRSDILLKDLPEEEQRRYTGSKSARESEIISIRIADERRAREIIETEGITGRSVAAALVTQIPDMLSMVGIEAIAARGAVTGALKATSIARQAGTAALHAAGQEAAFEAVKHAGQYERTLNETMFNVAGAAFIGGAIGAASGTARKLLAKNQVQLAEAVGEDSVRAISDVDPLMDDAVNLYLRPDMELAEKPYLSVKSKSKGVTGWVTKRLTPNGRIDGQYPEPVARLFREMFITRGISEANLAGETIIPVEASLKIHEVARDDVKLMIHSAYEAYIKANASWAERQAAGMGIPTPSVISEGEFDMLASRLAQDGAGDHLISGMGMETPDFHALPAAKAARNYWDVYWRPKIEGSKLIGDLGDRPNYFPHVWKIREMGSVPETVKADMAAALERLAQREGVDTLENELNDTAHDVFKTMTDLNGMSYGGIRTHTGPLRGRALDFPNDDPFVRKWAVQSLSESVERYHHYVAPRVEVAARARLTGEMQAVANQIEEIASKHSLGSLDDDALNNEIERVSKKVRDIWETYTGRGFNRGSIGAAEMKDLRAELRQTLDARKEFTRKQAGREISGVQDLRSSDIRRIRSDFEAELATVKDADQAYRNYSRKLSAELTGHEQDIANLRTAQAEAATAAERNTITAEIVKTRAEIQAKQNYLLYAERLSTKNKLTGTLDEIDGLRSEQTALRGYINALGGAEDIAARDLELATMEMDQTLSMSPVEAADTVEKTMAVSKESADHVLADIRSEKMTAKMAIDGIDGVREGALGEVKGLRAKVSGINGRIRDFQKAENLVRAVDDLGLKVKLYQAEGLAKADTQAAGKMLANKLDEISSVSADKIAAIKQAAKDDFARYGADRSAKLNILRIDKDGRVAIARDVFGSHIQSIRDELKQDVAGLVAEHKIVKDAIGRAISRKTGAERIQRMQAFLDSLRIKEAERAVQGKQGADRIDEFFDAARLKVKGNDAAVAKMDKIRAMAHADWEATVKVLTGTYGDPKDMSGVGRFIPALLRYNVTTKMGRVVLSQFNDVAALPLRYGTIRAAKAVANSATQAFSDDTWKASAKMVQRFVGAHDTITAARMFSMAEMDSAYLRKTGLEIGVDRLYKNMGKFSGYNMWSEGYKNISGQAAADLIRAAAKGELSKVDFGLVVSSGLDKKALDTIVARPWIERGGMSLPDFTHWPDDEITRNFGLAMRNLVDASTNQPTEGMRPFWNRSAFGRVATQFKNFYLGFYENTIGFYEQKLRLGDSHDRAQLASATFAFLTLGAASVYLKERSYGRTPDVTSGKFALDAMDQSGLLMLMMEPINAFENITGGKAGLRPMLGIDGPSIRHYGFDPGAVLGGPAYQTLYDGGAAAGQGIAWAATAAFPKMSKTGETLAPNRAFYKRLAKLIPYNNALLFSALYSGADIAGEATGTFDLPNEPRRAIPEALAGEAESGQTGPGL